MKHGRQRFAAVILVFAVALTGIFTGPIAASADESTTITVPLEGTYEYSYAYDVLDRINKERAKVGAEALTMSQSLLESAMLRAAECQVRFSHTRPDGESWYSVNAYATGENIAAGQNGPLYAMNSWMNSPGHKSNILDPGYKTVGVGCFIYTMPNGSKCYVWTQLFSKEEMPAYEKPANEQKTVDIVVDTQLYPLNFFLAGPDGMEFSATGLATGDTKKIYVSYKGADSFYTMALPPSAVSWKSSKAKILQVKENTLTAMSPGLANIYAYYKGLIVTGMDKVAVGPKMVTGLGVKSPKTRSIKATWKADKLSSGYEILIATDKNFTKNKKTISVKGGTTKSKDLTSLLKGKSYYVKIRAYKTAEGTKVYGEWCKAKTVKVK